MIHVQRAVTGLAVVFLPLALALVMFLAWRGISKPEIWPAAAGASISFVALVVSVLALVTADERSRFSNAFAIARKWDEPPLLEARNDLRKYLGDPGQLSQAIKEDPAAERALTHLVNFYWDMASAIETRWTASGYLRLRFRATLGTFYPAMRTLLETTKDRGASDALRSIDKLWRRWEG